MAKVDSCIVAIIIISVAVVKSTRQQRSAYLVDILEDASVAGDYYPVVGADCSDEDSSESLELGYVIINKREAPEAELERNLPQVAGTTRFTSSLEVTDNTIPSSSQITPESPSSYSEKAASSPDGESSFQKVPSVVSGSSRSSQEVLNVVTSPIRSPQPASSNDDSRSAQKVTVVTSSSNIPRVAGFITSSLQSNT